MTDPLTPEMLACLKDDIKIAEADDSYWGGASAAQVVKLNAFPALLAAAEREAKTAEELLLQRGVVVADRVLLDAADKKIVALCDEVEELKAEIKRLRPPPPE